jgi:saccharopine dehydrogenase-like NADP-dependent oxidoreductase
MSNLILGHLETVLDTVDRFACYVGGLPVERRWPYEYAAVFSPIDVIAEYTRPARVVEHGRVVTHPALSGQELLDLPGVGTLEAFNTDGLRSLLRTVSIPDMSEKTLRYPGHAERMRMLRETGFFSEKPVDVAGQRVRPIDLTSRLLFPAWQLGEGEEDLTVMRVEVEGRREGVRRRHTFDLLDRFDRASTTTSMARTTGYTCTAGVQAVVRGLYREPGLAPPELLGRAAGCYDLFMSHLEQRGVRFRHQESVLD